MKVNVYNFNNHNHADAGTFELYYKGPLAIHSGLYEGKNGAYGSPHHLNYYKRSIAQNTMLVYDPSEKFTAGRSNELRNDGGQRLPNNWLEPRSLTELLRDGYKTGTVTGQGFGPDPQKPAYTYLEGDITEAYSSKVKQVRRAFVFLNLGESNAPAALVVFDRVVSSNAAFRKYWLLHSMEEPVIEGNRATVRLTQLGWTGKLVNTTLLPEPANSDIAKVGGPGKEFWVFGENYPNAPRRGTPEESETGSWRIELSPKQPAETDCFLNVMQIMDGDAAPKQVEAVAGSTLAGLRLADRVVLFQRGERSLDREASFTARGAANLKYLVTGLAAGTWQVWRDGRILLPAVEVAGTAGTLYFEGPAGTYSLRR
jgi:heparin/heparan-sulfate lyase